MASSPLPGPTDILLPSPSNAYPPDPMNQPRAGHAAMKPNQVGQVILYGIPIVSLVIDGQERLFWGETRPPKLPDNFAFDVSHECAWGCRGSFIPARYNSSRAKCIKCSYCSMYFSPNKFIFHSHRTP
ncbi:PREDICTED: SKI family transcriptional corepressor 2-like, partial [Chlamydotis macqueenii]|uniref:SKI family transcriptional corepressor 2-like n=1 Tax=Chlamydotis macqueenii TaxID=187382 RepID=UPI000529F604